VRAPSQRTRLWINPAFQLRLLHQVGFYFLLYTLIVWVVGFFFEILRSFYINGFGQVQAQVYIEFFRHQEPLLLALVGVAPFFVFDLVRFTHRVAGPLHRFRSVMREMAAGKPVAEFTPRKGDLMPELFADFNALIKEWNARVGAVNGHAAANGSAAPPVTAGGPPAG
jgi:hypothetical protein